jgi:alpha-galactosidase
VVEPEMVNPDSDLYRAHPDWILQTGGRLPLSTRNQQVLDLAILERTDRIWTSDSNDALERQTIQRWTGLFLPPELRLEAAPG